MAVPVEEERRRIAYLQRLTLERTAADLMATSANRERDLAEARADNAERQLALAVQALRLLLNERQER